MLFPLPDKAPKRKGKGKIDLELLYQLGCKACPLAHIQNENPDMAPTGAEHPLIYILGEAPGAEEDEGNEQFIGRSGAMLRDRIEAYWPKMMRKIRWNNTVRTRPWEIRKNDRGLDRPYNRPPTHIEIACCRPSVEADIARSKPKAIFGFGNVPLMWATGFSGINAWRGRRVPVQIGGHVCWYYSMVHPSFLLRQGKRAEDYNGGITTTPELRYMPSEHERMFEFDLRTAFGEIEDIREATVLTPNEALANFTLITNCGDAALIRIEQELKQLSNEPVVGLDYETTTIRPYDLDIDGKPAVILSVAVGTDKHALAFPFDHPGADWTKSQRKRLTKIWVNFLRNCRAIKAVHNLMFELEWTGYFFGEDLIRAGKWECTQAQAADIDERAFGTEPKPLSLEFLMLQYFGLNVKKLANVDRKNLKRVPLPNVLEYNALDGRSHWLLYHKQLPQIREEGLTRTHKYMLRRSPALVLSQLKGIPVSQKLARVLDKKYKARFAETAAKIAKHKHALAYRRAFHEDFNPLSSDDARKLFGKMLNRPELQVVVKEKEKFRKREKDEEVGDKKETANKAVLRTIPGALPKLILIARETNKRHGYVNKLLAGHPKSSLYPDGLLHPKFNTWVARTGRMSAENPSVQNWPKRDSEAKEVRKPIVADEDCVILAVDYGQIEARVIAMYTKDKRFVKALWENYDIHQEWAERIARAYPARIGGKQNLTDKAVMKTFRTDIKNQWTFPLVFGATVPSIAEYLQINEEIVKQQVKEFWRHFDGIRDWQQEQIAFYRENGYVETFTGRRRRGPLSPNMVYNSPVQGVTAEIVMDAFCRLSEVGDPVLQAELNIHDDLTFLRVPERRVDDYLEKIVGMMIKPPFEFINVPISVEASVGYNWLEMEEVGVFSSDKWE